MSEDLCPKCGVDLNGEKIPYDKVHNYVPLEHYNNPSVWLADNEWPTWKRKIGIQVWGVYDGVLIWRCPDCGHNWPRFPNEPYWQRLHDKAVSIIAEWERNGKAG